MTTRILPEGRAPWLDSEGKPLSNGRIHTYAPGTSAPKATYYDRSKAVAHANPIQLDADGRPPGPIYWDGAYKYLLEDQFGAIVYFQDNYGDESATITADGASLLPNGGFETDSDGDGLPDEWTVTVLGANSVAIDASSAYSGANSLKFTTSDGNQAGVAASALIPWAEGEALYCVAAVRSNNPNLTNSIVVYWYSNANTILSSATLYTDGGVAPTAYTVVSGNATAPAGARFAQIRIEGADGGGTDVGSSWFDALTVERKVAKAADADGLSQRLAFDRRSAFRGALAYRSSIHAIPDSVETAVPFNAEAYDTDSIHSTSTNTERLTVPSGVARVRLAGGVFFAATSSGYRSAVIRKNGSGFPGSTTAYLTSLTMEVSGHSMTLQTPVIDVSAGDYFELFVYQNSGAALGVTSNSTWLAMEIIE